MLKRAKAYITAYKTKLSNWLIYNKLKLQGLSDSDIAESYIFPSDLTPKQKERADAELRRVLAESRKKRNTNYENPQN